MSLIALVLLALVAFLWLTDTITFYFWTRIYRVGNVRSAEKIILAGYVVPLFLFFVSISVSSFTPYLVLLTLRTYWMIWGVGILAAHLICVFIGIFRRILDQVEEFLEQTFFLTRTFSGGIHRKIQGLLFIGSYLLKSLKPIIQETIRDSKKAYRLYAAGMMLAAGCLILQAIFYLCMIGEAGKIVDAHGGYPLLRKIAETTADVGTLLLLPLLVLTSFLSRNRQNPLQ